MEGTYKITMTNIGWVFPMSLVLENGFETIGDAGDYIKEHFDGCVQVDEFTYKTRKYIYHITLEVAENE